MIRDPSLQRYRVAELLACPFGALGSVLGWYRVGAFWKSVMRRLFRVLLYLYVDDGQVVDARCMQGQAQRIFWKMTALARWKLDPEKSQAMGPAARLLGNDVELTARGVVWRLATDTAHRWKAELDAIAEADAMSAEEAAVWAGRLQWGCATTGVPAAPTFARCIGGVLQAVSACL